MPDSVERTLRGTLSDPCRIGQIFIRKTNGGGFILCHRDDKRLRGLQEFRDPEAAIEIAKFDDAGNYRPLKTAPNLRHGWQLELADLAELRRALDYFYPGRLALFVSWKNNQIRSTPLRDTLNRQSGMYRAAAAISDEQLDDLVGTFCRSDGGCLRTILWKRDANGRAPSTKLPLEKFDPVCDQMREAVDSSGVTIPVLCQEACNLLVNEARKMVKGAQ
jgi:sirohydrochlorin cobaltochelatase